MCDQNIAVMYDITEKANRDSWRFIKGQRQGCSPSASGTNHLHRLIVWNMPFEAVYQSKNPSGWPQIVISVLGYDYLGKSFVQGYGSTHIPASPGK